MGRQSRVISLGPVSSRGLDQREVGGSAVRERGKGGRKGRYATLLAWGLERSHWPSGPQKLEKLPAGHAHSWGNPSFAPTVLHVVMDLFVYGCFVPLRLSISGGRNRSLLT